MSEELRRAEEILWGLLEHEHAPYQREIYLPRYIDSILERARLYKRVMAAARYVGKVEGDPSGEWEKTYQAALMDLVDLRIEMRLETAQREAQDALEKAFKEASSMPLVVAPDSEQVH